MLGGLAASSRLAERGSPPAPCGSVALGCCWGNVPVTRPTGDRTAVGVCGAVCREGLQSVFGVWLIGSDVQWVHAAVFKVAVDVLCCGLGQFSRGAGGQLCQAAAS